MKDKKIVIDAENAVMGRLADHIAKRLLKGEVIVVVNSEKAIITGNKKDIQTKYLEKRNKVGGLLRGPKVSRDPEKMLKRAVRGMLPWKKERGDSAMKRLRCHNKIPKEFEEVKKEKFVREIHSKFIKLKDVYGK
jgi:large subunit ribosomal protein L13